MLAWHLAKGTVAIPKSVTPSRIEENLASVNVKLTAEDIAAVDALSTPEVVLALTRRTSTSKVQLGRRARIEPT